MAPAMRAAVWVVPMLLLAGCTSNEPSEDDEPAGPAASGCTLRFPDNSSTECGGATQPLLDDLPATEGWRCTRETDHRGQNFQLWQTPTGEFAGRFEFDLWKDDASNFARVGLYTGQDDGRAVFAEIPRSGTGFLEFPEPLPESGTIDVHLTVRAFRLWVENGTGWDNIPQPTVVADHWGGDGWFGIEVNTTQGPRYIDLMVPDPEDDEYSQWGTRDFDGVVGGERYLVDVTASGIKHNQADAESMRQGLGVCSFLPGDAMTLGVEDG